MEHHKRLLMLLTICACTCRGKTECSDRIKVAVMMNFNSRNCQTTSNIPSQSQNLDNSSTWSYNYTSNGLLIEILFLDTCGSDSETLKGVFKTLSWMQMDCLQPPYSLGFVGPNSIGNLNIALRITSALQITHIVGIESMAPHVHFFPFKWKHPVVKGVFELIKLLQWKYITLKTNIKTESMKEISRDFLTKVSFEKICIQDLSSNIIYIGEPDKDFLRGVRNSSIIVMSEKNMDDIIKTSDLSNFFLIVDGISENKVDIGDLDEQFIHWMQRSMININQANWIHWSIRSYARSLHALCSNENCFDDQNHSRWNTLIGQTINSFKEEVDEGMITFRIKEKDDGIESSGWIKIHQNNVEFILNGQKINLQNSSDRYKVLPQLINLNALNQNNNDCKSEEEIIRMIDNLDVSEKMTSKISETEDSEWLTMIATVSAVGITMFLVGFCAIYVVYTNIRGPRNNKETIKREIERDLSLRRVGSGSREYTDGDRTPKVKINLQRRDSRSSIKSDFSDKTI